FRRFDSPVQSINALETHDNATAWDKMHACCGEEPREVRLRRQKLMIAATLVAQGIPFLHAGMEFCGTKQDNSNSYNAGDVINQMNWDRMILNYDIVRYTQRMIQLRRNWKAFRLDTAALVEKYVHFSIVEGGVVLYDIDYNDGHHQSAGVRVIINPSLDERRFHFEHEYSVIADENGFPQEGEQAEIYVPRCSTLVLSRPISKVGE
ncbi:MAG: hypothetical protein IKF60_05275, partial [Solobacterium sp.]|nr:hypothetical protein [Solobacterium sp.]